MDQLTEDQRQEVEDVFSLIDENQSGSIDKNELAKGLRCLGLNPTNSDITSLLEEFDKDKNKGLNLEEFASLYRKYIFNHSSSENSLIDHFKKLDVNGDGFIDAEELRKILKYGEDKMDDEEVNQLLKEFDKNGDGKISLNEFVQGVLSF